MNVPLVAAANVLLAASCMSFSVANKNHQGVVFSNIESDFEVEDLNSYGCGRIEVSHLKHVLEYGSYITERDLHDEYSTVGCSIQGSLLVNGEKVNFAFDYGGIFYFGNGKVMACGESCCSDSFKYCTWNAK